MDETIDWRLATWEGARREQLRRWAALPLAQTIQAIEDMAQFAAAISSPDGTPSLPGKEIQHVKENS